MVPEADADSMEIFLLSARAGRFAPCAFRRWLAHLLPVRVGMGPRRGSNPRHGHHCSPRERGYPCMVLADGLDAPCSPRERGCSRGGEAGVTLLPLFPHVRGDGSCGGRVCRGFAERDDLVARDHPDSPDVPWEYRLSEGGAECDPSVEREGRTTWHTPAGITSSWSRSATP